MPIHSAIGFSTGHRNHQSTGQIKAAIIFLNFPASACNANLNLQTRGPRQPNRMRTWRARRGERRRTRWWTAAAGGGGVSWLPQTVLSKFCVAQSRRRRRLPAPPPPSSGGEPLRTLRLTGSPPTSRGAANSVFSGPANYSWAHGPSYSVMLTEKTMAWTPTKPTHRWPPVGPVSDDDVLSSHSCLMMSATKMLA